MGNKKDLSPKHQKILWGRNHNLCSICKAKLIENKTDGSAFPVGVHAHIEGENPGSARYNPNLDESIENSYENRILVCPNCHTKIDNDEEQFTTEKLKQIKREHEEWCDQAIKSSMPDITYAELEIILKHFEKSYLKEEDEKLIPIHPKDKINKNELTKIVEDEIRIGLIKFPLVKNFINEFPDISFGDRLRTIFIEQYNELKVDYSNDSLFYALWDFASGFTNDFKLRSAGLTVLTYFFQQCDVFES